MGLISQFFPQQYPQVMDGKLASDGLSLVLSRTGVWCDVYAAACGVKL